MNEREKLLKRAYKEARRPMGIYKIENKKNGKILIGSSLNLDGTWNSNSFQLNYGVHKNKALQKEWTEYGGENFKFEVVEYLEHLEDEFNKDYREDLKVLEDMWLEKLQPFDCKGYNRKKK